MLTVSFTGHRPNKLFGYNREHPKYKELSDKIRGVLDSLIEEYNPDRLHFIQGMALGVDQLCAEVCFGLRQELKGIVPVVVEAAIPCLNQESMWPVESQFYFNRIKENCDIVTYVSDQLYTPVCMVMRNRYMVDHSDVLVAVYNGDLSGGTYGCVNYARASGKRIEYIKPY